MEFIDPDQYYHINDGVDRASDAYVMSRSDLLDYFDNPWKWRNGYTSKETDAMAFGNMMDTKLLTPKLFPKRYVIAPYKDFKTNEAQFFRDLLTLSEKEVDSAYVVSPHEKHSTKIEKLWKEENAGDRTIVTKSAAERARTKVEEVCQRLGVARLGSDTNLITPQDMSEIDRANKSFMDEPYARIFTRGAPQVVQLGTLEDVNFRCMIDWAPHDDDERCIVAHDIPMNDCLVDFKTGNDASFFGFRGKVKKFRYDIQGSIYLNLWNQTHDLHRHHYVLVTMENYFPYASACYILSQRDLRIAEVNDEYPHGWRFILDNFRADRAMGHYPSYNRSAPIRMSVWE